LNVRRHICYLTGTRADFGLLQSTLVRMNSHAAVRLSIVATGTHLSDLYGNTLDEIRAAGLHVAAALPTELGTTRASMTRAIGELIIQLIPTLQQIAPDCLLVLGDRGEMLAGAICAGHLGIPVVHIHGGERSGTIDEPVRHAISKLSHLHLVATDESRMRLIRMGESPDTVFVTGAPGLDGLKAMACVSRLSLTEDEGLNDSAPIALFQFHPVHGEERDAYRHTSAALDGLVAAGCSQIVALQPNADSGNSDVRTALADALDRYPGLRLHAHLPRPRFVSWLAHCDVFAGNSSSGIIEAATFGTPVVNIGTRQHLRERNQNVIDCGYGSDDIARATLQALQRGRTQMINLFGDGNAGTRILDRLLQAELTSPPPPKLNTY
jgi:GDP/UDP-N,N'-diacetylbacillosamine 2-epimerase (hydrolysing)